MKGNEISVRNQEVVEVDALSRVLRSELAACETYRTAVHGIERDADAPALSLRCLYQSHRQHADRLRLTVRRLGGRPAAPPGASGAWPRVEDSIADAADRVELLRSLREGERHSVEVAREALHELEGPVAALVREEILPALAANLDLLAALDAHGAE